MADPIRMGLLGLGRISTLHLAAYEPSHQLNAKVEAICDVNKKKAEEIAQIYHIDKVYTDYLDLLHDSSIDAVEILTPHHLHLEHTLKACEAGKHISLQKVPALTLSEMDQMIAAAKKAKVKFRVFENFRFYPPYLRANELIDQGVIGQPERVDYSMIMADKALSSWEVPLESWKWRFTEKGNYKAPTIFDDGYHKHSVISQFLREPIESIMTWQGVKHIKGVIRHDSPFVIIYSCKNKSRFAVWTASLHDFVPMHSKYYGCDEYVAIYGTKGAIYVPGCTGSFYQACGAAAPGQPGVHWVDETGTWHSEINLDTDWMASFINCSREFIEALRMNRDPELNPVEARYILQITLAAIRSVRNNFAQIKIKDIKDHP